MNLETMPPIPDPSAGSSSPARLRDHALRAFRFGIVSGMGLALDLSLFVALLYGGVPPFAANTISSWTALTFVYCASVRRVFRYHGQFIVPLFVIYVLYHLCGTLFVSWGISGLAQAGVAPPLTKVGIIPATFTANYLFMSWLTARRGRWILQMSGLGAPLEEAAE